MKIVSIIETAEELIRIAKGLEAEGPNQYLPENITLIIEGDIMALRLQDKQGTFRLSEGIDIDDLVSAMASECNIAVHFT